jgi:hypothetical protein
MIGRVGKRVALVAGIAVVSLVSAGGGQAFADEPWWHVNTVYAPAQKSGGEGFVDVEVSNLGDAATSGTWGEHIEEVVARGETKGLITVTEKLPAGLEVTDAERAVQTENGGGRPIHETPQAEFEADLELFRHAGFNVPKPCSVVGQTVTCLFGAPIGPYERMILAINVRATPGAAMGVNEVSVSGGGAAPVASRRTLSPDEATPSYGVENYELKPEEEGGAVDTQAGSHPFQLTTTLAVNTQTVHSFRQQEGPTSEGAVVPEAQPISLTKDLRFDIPAGLIGNPEPLPKCSLLTFTRQNISHAPQCPEDTVVGVSTPIVTNVYTNRDAPLALSEPLYSLEPAVGEPARFGFQTPYGPVILDTSVRTGGDYGVVVTVPNIVDAPFMGDQLTFWGVPADPRHDSARGRECLGSYVSEMSGGAEVSCPAGTSPQPFLIMPTSCLGPLHTTVEADSWSTPGVFGAPGEYTLQTGAGGIGEPYGLDGCNRLNFEPSINVTPDGQEGSTPTGLTVDEHVAQQASLNPTGLADSTVKNTTVALPAGVALNPAGADGLSACGLGEIGLESSAEQTCPESAKVGTVEVHTPLLPNPLVGAAYLATQNANPFGSLVALYIVARDPVSGVLIKVAGQVTPNLVTGQLVATFKETPQLPFEDLSLHFFGGSRAPLGTPALCGGYTTTASIAPWSGNAPVQSASEFKITSGPNGMPCSDPLPFDPTLTAGSTNIQTGTFTQFTMTMSREDGNQNLDAIKLRMPEGLIGSVADVKLCGEAQADAGTCGPESLIGQTTVSVGLGGNPYTVTGGEVFITGPYDGAPFGLSIVNPAKAGPFNLGKVVVRAKIEVDPVTSALTITTDPSGPYAIPQLIDGIPLQIKHVNVAIDRSRFVFNPTNCTPTAITGDLTSSEGATAALSVPFQVTNCATLKFKPQFAVSTSGKTSKAGGASLDVKLTYPVAEGQANIAKVKVELPKQLPSRLTTLQKACTEAVFDANPENCPAASKIGEAVATTPVIAGDFTGPAYFVSHGGASFPELIVVLKGEDGVTVDLHGETYISKAGITSSTFATVPDVPVGSFELKLPQGPYSALAANGSLCRDKLVMPTEFVAQNGAVIHQTTKIAVTGCPKAVRHERKKAHKKHGKGKGGKKGQGRKKATAKHGNGGKRG